MKFFNKGKESFTATVKVSAPWIKISNTSIQVEPIARFQISIDWSKAPKGEASGSVRITGTGWGGATIVVTAAPYLEYDFYSLDPSVTLQKTLLDTGGLLPSYLGPKESRQY